jgi:hypothetical protein
MPLLGLPVKGCESNHRSRCQPTAAKIAEYASIPFT